MSYAQAPRHSQSRQKLSVRASGLTDRGRVRDTNQDAFYVNAESGLFMVCDGNGRRLCRSIAAHAVTRILPTMIELRGTQAQQEVPASVRAVLTKSLAALSMMLYEWKK